MAEKKPTKVEKATDSSNSKSETTGRSAKELLPDKTQGSKDKASKDRVSKERSDRARPSREKGSKDKPSREKGHQQKGSKDRHTKSEKAGKKRADASEPTDSPKTDQTEDKPPTVGDRKVTAEVAKLIRKGELLPPNDCATVDDIESNWDQPIIPK